MQYDYDMKVEADNSETYIRSPCSQSKPITAPSLKTTLSRKTSFQPRRLSVPPRKSCYHYAFCLLRPGTSAVQRCEEETRGQPRLSENSRQYRRRAASRHWLAQNQRQNSISQNLHTRRNKLRRQRWHDGIAVAPQLDNGINSAAMEEARPGWGRERAAALGSAGLRSDERRAFVQAKTGHTTHFSEGRALIGSFHRIYEAPH